MTYRVWPLLLGVAFVVPALFAAEDKFTITVKDTAKGGRELNESVSSEEIRTQILTADGKSLQDKTEKKVTTQKYTETVLERPKDKRATKLRRAYEKCSVKKGDMTTRASFEGKTVLIEKGKDDKYHFFVGDTELTGKDAELLEKEFNRDRDADSGAELKKLMLPTHPVALNQVWKIDAKKFAKLLGELPIDADKAQVSGMLVKAYRKDGHQFGIIDYRFEMPLKGEIGPAGKAIPITAGSKFVGQATLDIAIDGAVTDGKFDMEVTIDLNGTLKANDNELKLVIKTKGKETKTGKELPPEK